MRNRSQARLSMLLLLAMLLGLSSVVSPAMAQVATPGATPPAIVPVEATPDRPVTVEQGVTPEVPAEVEIASPDAVLIQPDGATPDPALVVSPAASPSASPVADVDSAVDLDVLFIGAHPDDEAFALGTYGQWNEFNDIEVGVITITRGEGGGNAVGTEEGPALGLLREDEERRAVGVAGIDHIYNLDEVDFYYTVSAELTAETWGYEDTLERIVRVIRETQPEVIITMNPAPTPGQHGHHQVAARLAIDAFYSAADPSVFPDQVENEGLDVWRASRILRSSASGEGTPGPRCAETYQPVEPTDVIYGVWNGTESEVHGETWATLERQAQQTYASQGWAVFPDAPSDPNEITCDFFTLIDSRAPFDPTNTSTTAILEGAVLPVDNGLLLGSEFYLTTDVFEVAPGEPFEVTAHLRSEDLDPSVEVGISVPEGWTISELGEPVEADGELQWTAQVTPAEDAEIDNRVRVNASVTTSDGTTVTSKVVEVTADVTGELEPLAEVAYFREWVEQVGVPQLDSLIFPVFSMGVGETRDIAVDVTNTSSEPASGTVTLELPAGFEAESATQEFGDLAPDATESLSFTLANTDESLLSSNEGGEEGTYAVTITTSTDDGDSVQDAGINLVPSTTVPKATATPVVDGVVDPDVYTGEALDLSRVWEGDPVDSPEDGSGTAYVTYTEEGIYVAVKVTDDELGTVLPMADAKRHWRTDSVEIAIDPLGTAGNTSATFKVGVFPTTQEGEPAAYRDADAFQGPVSETAPGFEVASTVSDPYNGYVVEVLIPFEALPADIDSDNARMNIFIYDSDTQDLTGQTRLGWSTWQGVQGDPYRWGKIDFEGFTRSADARTTPNDPIMPLEAAQSADSPISVLQSANDGVPLAGKAPVPDGEGLVVEAVVTEDGEHAITFTSRSSGAVHVFLLVDGEVVGEYRDTVSEGVTRSYAFPQGEGTDEGQILVSFVDEEGRVQAIAEPLP